MNAEIHLNEPFGKAIFDHVIRHNCQTNLEIGSWDGEGSTRCFIEAMKMLDNPIRLDCVELNEKKFEVLRERYQSIPFFCPHLGSSISYEELVLKDFERIWNSIFNRLTYPKDMVKSWFESDVETLKACTSFLGNTRQVIYDSVLIDGGEFTGYSEYSLLCRDGMERVSKLIFLDDVHHAYKCNQVYHELKSSSKWELSQEDPGVRNGYAIFKRVG